jgi:hypothetical protein
VSLEEEIHRVADALFEIAAALRRDTGPTQPGPFKAIRFLTERKVENMDLRTYEVDFPAVPATSPDGDAIVAQIFGYAVNSTAVPDQSFDVSVTMATIEVPQGSTVDLFMTHEDDDGKRGPAQTQQFVAEDSVGPDAPGAFGAVRFISERSDGS